MFALIFGISLIVAFLSAEMAYYLTGKGFTAVAMALACLYIGFSFWRNLLADTTE